MHSDGNVFKIVYSSSHDHVSHILGDQISEGGMLFQVLFLADDTLYRGKDQVASLALAPQTAQA